MREALEKFLSVIEEDRKVEMREEMVEKLALPLAKPVSDVVGDCQIITSNCYVNSNSSHHVISSFPWHCASQEVATDMSY